MEGVRPETADAPSGGRWRRLATQRPCGKAEGRKVVWEVVALRKGLKEYRDQ